MSSIDKMLRPGDALFMVEVQIDFCPGGALPVPEGDRIVPVLNRWIAAAVAKSLPVYASRDWHPLQHTSFKAQGGEWPPHCVQDSEGARFHPDLNLPASVVKVTKGVRFDHDQYSAFDETGLAVQLRRDGVRRLFVGGLAEDVCVRATILDALKEGFAAVLILDGTRALTAAGDADARQEILAAGAQVV